MNLIKKILVAQATVLALWAVTAQATTDEAIAERLKPVGEVCVMGEHVVAGARAWRVGFGKEGDSAAGMGFADQLHGHRAVGNIDQLTGLVDDLGVVVLLHFEGEELDQRHGDSR